jgi:hypothetical protein
MDAGWKPPSLSEDERLREQARREARGEAGDG